MKNGKSIMSCAPKVSVVVINYNYGAFIEEALESILRQTYQNFEIIVVDDGSLDNSRLVVEAMMQRYPNKINYYYQHNQGVGVARNTGLSLVTGDLVAFLDADDVWLPEKLFKQVPIFNQFPEVGFCCGDYLNFMPDKEIGHFASLVAMKNFKYEIPLPDIYTLKELFKVNFVGTFTAIFKRSLIDQVGSFKPELKQCEDYDYWLRCAMVTKFFVLNEFLVKRRIHGNNITSNYLVTAQYQEKVLIDFYSQKYEYLKDNGLISNIKDTIADNKYMIGNLQFEKGHRFNSLKSYREALFCNLTFNNFIVFFGVIFKKSLRIISFGLISRKNLR